MKDGVAMHLSKSNFPPPAQHDIYPIIQRFQNRYKVTRQDAMIHIKSEWVRTPNNINYRQNMK